MLLPLLLKSQTETIVFHNCENLFFPTDDPAVKDDEFTFSSARFWGMERFNKKKDMLAKTYIDLAKGGFPSIIGLCEVENKRVLETLCLDSPLRKGNYSYIHYDSKDIRGIDVAMLYRKDRFKIISHKSISVDDGQIVDEPTRDILYVNGVLQNTNLHIFVVHAPSRRNRNRNKPLRKTVFQMLYKEAKTLYDKGEKNIIIMGDMNDNPWDKTIKEAFHTSGYGNYTPLLTNLMEKDKGKRSSYVYSGKMLSFDQFLVSQDVLNRIDYSSSFHHVFTADYLIDKNAKTPLITPLSTYKGYKYQGGVSDHFPIYLKLKFPKK